MRPPSAKRAKGLSSALLCERKMNDPVLASHFVFSSRARVKTLPAVVGWDLLPSSPSPLPASGRVPRAVPRGDWVVEA